MKNRPFTPALIEVAHTAAILKPSPIQPSWIVEGDPVAQASVLSKSTDGLAWTMVWQCSDGKFNWYYQVEETILILEGSIVLESDTMSPTRYGPGDVIFFKDGAHAKWHVEGHVRKLAFLRRPHPILLGFALRTLFKIKRTLVPAVKRKIGSLMVVVVSVSMAVALFSTQSEGATEPRSFSRSVRPFGSWECCSSGTLAAVPLEDLL